MNQRRNNALFFFIISLATFPAWGEEIDNNFFLFKDNIHGLEYQTGTETSSASGFSALDATTSMTAHDLHLKYGREFLSSKRISVTLSFGGGLIRGQGEASLQEQNVSYEAELTNGYVGLAEISLNLNFNISGMRIQPFIAGSFLRRHLDYEISYSAIGGGDLTKIIYDSETDYQSLSLGSRFFNKRESLMSYFSVNYNLSATNTTSLQAGSIAGTTIDITNSNPNDLIADDLSFSIGAGATF